jgi:hypothetical protein
MAELLRCFLLAVFSARLPGPAARRPSPAWRTRHSTGRSNFSAARYSNRRLDEPATRGIPLLWSHNEPVGC